ncbi:MAG TPA: hypothetical protein VG347_06315 [Verrucomicrobiae bacterium]|nr:hypothetical protein [Verrucomicrobiae bacterium]
MKKLKLIAVALWACLSFNAFAIEGIQITVPSTNAVLSWPSDTSESYLIQHRHALTDTDGWQTVADQYPPDYSGTNITYFTDTNTVDFGYTLNTTNIGTGSTGSMPGGTNMVTFTNIGTAVPGQGFYQVVRDGVHLVGISNDMVLTGVVKIPVELGNGSGSVSTMSLTENETPIGNSLQTVPLSDPHYLTVNTTLLANGSHDIYGTAQWDDTNGGLWQADSPVATVTVSNEVSFENFMGNFGELDDTLLIRATSAHTNTDWQVDVYDSTYSYVGSFTGHADDGDIYVVWNLEDYYGVYHTNDNFFVCEVSTEYVDPPTPPIYKITDPWSGNGAWAEAMQHAWDGAIDRDTLYEELNGFANIPSSMGASTFPPKDDDRPHALTFGAENPEDDSDWALFRTAIYNPLSRNLVYFGHGGQNGLGYNPTTTNRFITATEIANTLHTIPAGQTNRHAYRFVFVDACSTALGKMPEAFGIIHKEDVQGIDYINSSTRFATYVGWPKDKYIGILDGAYINYDHVNFIQHVQFEMIYYGNSIKQAIRNASHYSDTYGEFGEESMKVFGYWDLSIGAYNN